MEVLQKVLLEVANAHVSKDTKEKIVKLLQHAHQVLRICLVKMVENLLVYKVAVLVLVLMDLLVIIVKWQLFVKQDLVVNHVKMEEKLLEKQDLVDAHVLVLGLVITAKQQHLVQLVLMEKCVLTVELQQELDQNVLVPVLIASLDLLVK